MKDTILPIATAAIAAVSISVTAGTPTYIPETLRTDFTTVTAYNGPACAAIIPDSMLVWGQRAADAGDYKTSNNIYHLALEAGVDSLACLEGFADNALATGDYQTVLEVCPKIRELQEWTPHTLSYEVLANTGLNRIDTAANKVIDMVYMVGIDNDSYSAMTGVAEKNVGLMAERFKAEKSVDPENPIWDECLGTIYTYAKLYDKAVEAFLAALRLDPENDEDAASLSLLYNQLRRYDSALFYAEQALARNPRYYPYMTNKAMILRNADRGDEAVKYLSTILASDSTAVNLYINRGTLLNSKGEYAAAVNDFNAALSLDKHNASALLRKGIAEYNLGNRDEACNCFRTVVALDYPDWGGTAIANAYLGNRESVDAYINKVLESKRKADNYFNLAALCDIMHRPQEAMRYLNQALEQNSLNPDIIPYDPNLREVKALPEYADLLTRYGVSAPNM